MRFDAQFWERVYYLVFSGGAMNGLAYVGVLQVLEQVHPKLYEQARGFAGTSIGALVALLLAIGYTSDTIRAVIDDFDAGTMFSRSDRLFHNMGMADADATLGHWVGNLIHSYMGKHDVNFAELYRRTHVELTVVVTNFSQQRLEYWNRHTQPGTSVRTAVTASMALPLVFTPLCHAASGDLYLDGGLGDNFPLHVFPPQHTLGVRINVKATPPFASIVDFCTALLDLKDALARGHRAGCPDATTRAPVIVIPSTLITGLNFLLPAADRTRLASHGVHAALVWLLQGGILAWAWCRLHGVPWFQEDTS